MKATSSASIRNLGAGMSSAIGQYQCERGRRQQYVITYSIVTQDEMMSSADLHDTET